MDLENFDKLKRCAACQEWLAESQFHVNSATHDGRHAYCRLCRKRKRLARILAGGDKPRVRAQGVPVYTMVDGEWRLIDVLLPGGWARINWGLDSVALIVLHCLHRQQH